MANGLGRVAEFDIRSREYPIRTLLSESPLRTHTWPCDAYLNQGSEGACVGFSWTHEIAAEPIVGEVSEHLARYIYLEAQKVDQWPGEDYEGTSVIAGAKIMQKLGWLSEYRWAFGLTDALGAVSEFGPVILGINWYEGMWDTDASGFIYPTGRIVGGHAILMNGIDLDKGAVLLHNSWGPSWGVNGRAWLSFESLERLLSESGEACVPMVRSIPDIEPEPTEPQGCLPALARGFFPRLTFRPR